jgi:hypothetical protein
LQSSSGVVRASSSILSATWAVEIQTFWPSTARSGRPCVRRGLQLGGVQAGVGFGDGEAGLVLAGDQRRQHAALLLIVPNTTTGCRPKMFMCTAEAPDSPAPDARWRSS